MEKNTGFYPNRAQQRWDIAECSEVHQVGLSDIRGEYETFTAD